MRWRSSYFLCSAHMLLANLCFSESYVGGFYAWSQPPSTYHCSSLHLLQLGGEVSWTHSTNEGWKSLDKCSLLPSFGGNILRKFYLVSQKLPSGTEPQSLTTAPTSITHLVSAFPSSHFCTLFLIRHPKQINCISTLTSGSISRANQPRQMERFKKRKVPILIYPNLGTQEN